MKAFFTIIIAFVLMNSLNLYGNKKKDPSVIRLEMQKSFDLLLLQNDPVIFNLILDTILTQEIELAEHIFGQEILSNFWFLDDLKCNAIARICPDTEALLKSLEKYPYTKYFNLNYVLNRLYFFLYHENKQSSIGHQFLLKSFSYHIGPYQLYNECLNNKELIDKEALMKIIKLVEREFSDDEIAAFTYYITKSHLGIIPASYVIKIRFGNKSMNLSDKDQIYFQDSLVKSEFYKALDSIKQQQVPLILPELLNIDVNKEVIFLGNFDDPNIIGVLNKVIRNSENKYSKHEKRSAILALAKLGDTDMEKFALRNYIITSEDLFYIGTQSSIYELTGMLKDSLSFVECSALSHLYDPVFAEQQIPLCYKVLWQMLSADLITNFPYTFKEPYEKYDYCLFYDRKKESQELENLLNKSILWMENNRCKYVFK